jgi:hypothetical protein
VAVVLLEDRGHARARDRSRRDEPEAEDEERTEGRERQHRDDRDVLVECRAALARPGLRRRNSARGRELLGRCALPRSGRTPLRCGQPGGASLSLETRLPPQSLGALGRLGLLRSPPRGQDLRRSRPGRRRVVDRCRWRRRLIRRRRRRRRPDRRRRRRHALDGGRIRLRPGRERRRARSAEPGQHRKQSESTRPAPTSRLSPNSHFRTPHLLELVRVNNCTIAATWE